MAAASRSSSAAPSRSEHRTWPATHSPGAIWASEVTRGGGGGATSGGGMGGVAACCAFGASCSLPCDPAMVSFLNRELALSLGGWNWSSCPTPAVRNTRRDRLNRVDTCPWQPGFDRPPIPQRTFKYVATVHSATD